MAYGTPRTPRRDRAATTPTSAAAGRRPPSSSPTSTRRYDAIGGHLAARRAHRGAARRAAGARSTRRRPGAYDVALGLKHADAEDRGRPSPRWPTRGVERIVGLVLAPHYSALSVGEYLDRAARRRRRRTASPFVGVESWATEPAFVDFLAADVARPAGRRCRRRPRWCSPPTRSRSASSPPATRTRTSCAATAAGRRRRGRARRRPVVDRLAVGRPHARAVARARHPRGRRRAGRPSRRRRRARVRRAASSPTTSRCCTTSTSRPRARADAAGPRVRPHGVRQRRPGRDGRARRPRRRRMRERATAHVVVVGGGITGLDRRLRARRRCCPTPSIELREADDRLGGKIRTSPFAGLAGGRRGRRRVPRPGARTPPRSPRDVGLGDDADVARPPRTAAVWYDGLHPIPDGLAARRARPTCVRAGPQPRC